MLDHLDAAVSRVRDRDGAPRWTPRESLHLTVAFFGEVPDRQVDDLTAALAEAETPPGPVRLRLDGAGTFPGRGPPRVLWVGVDGEVGKDDVTDMLKELDLENDSWLLYGGAEQLPLLPPRAFNTSRASTRRGPGAGSGRGRRPPRGSVAD